MFDSIIREADERFDLNGKAGTLLSALLFLMTDDKRGGIAGFLEKFNQANPNDASASWISSNENAEITNEQAESALGKETLDAVSNQTGISYDKTLSSSAFMIPRVINTLTPDGVVPPDGDLLSRIGGFLPDADEPLQSNDAAPTEAVGKTFDRIGTAATSTADEDKTGALNAEIAADRIGSAVDEDNSDPLNRISDKYKINNSPFGWILPLLLLGLLLTLGYWFCSRTAIAPETRDANSNQTNPNSANQ